MSEVRKWRVQVSRFALCAGLLLLLASPGFAQTESARIIGNVTDASGAALPGATVTVTEIGTERAVTANAGDDGAYSVAGLSPGRYRIEVTQAGFKTTRQEVTLEIQQVASLNFALEAGGVSEVIEVTADAPLVEASTSAIGEVIQGRQIVELPLNGRNVLELARLVPGVTQGVPSGFATGVGGNAETFVNRNTGGAALSVNGQRTQANNFLLDGVDNNESLVNTIQIFPSADAVQEFRVQTSVAPAEFGRGGGGIVNAATRSGRQDFFGSLFTFIRNDNFDARPTFDTRKNEFRRGQFGGTLGGPLYLPRFGEGGPRKLGGENLFFFTDYEGLRQFLPLGADIATVPTEAFRRGDFSVLLNPAASGLTSAIQLTDPLTGLPIPGNRLDLLSGNRLNPVGLAYLSAFPLPNRGSQVLGNYQNTRVEILDQDTFDFRVDGNFNASNQMFGRISWGRAQQETTSRLTTLPAGFGSGSNFRRTRQAVVGLTSVLTPSLVNELRLQAARINFGFQPPFFERAVSAELGIPNANRDPLLGGGALIGGFNSQLEYTGDFGLYTVPQNTYQLVDSVTYTTGNHTLRFGGQVLRRHVSLFRPNRGKGFFFLVGNGEADGIRLTGFEQSDLLIGFVNNYSVGPPFGTVGTFNWENAGFVQDDWRVSPRLTLNLGLRYEYFTNPTEQYGRQANFDLDTGRLILASGSDDALVDQDRNDFSPRVGFAYDLRGDGRSVIRGGYGLFYFLDRGGIDNQLAQNPPFSGFSQFNYSQGFRITLQGRCPNNTNDSRLCTGPLPTGDVSNVDVNNPQNVSVLAILPDNRTANVHQFNVQYQHQLTNETALSVGYVATRGRNLSNYFNINGGRIGGGARPFPNLGDVRVRDDSGESSYDSLQLQLERRFTDGFQYLVAYTFSRTRDNAFGAFDAPDAGGRFIVEEFGRSNLDFPHVFTFSSVADLPFGRGRRYGSDLPRAADYVLGGWQLNTIVRLQSGQPFDVRRGGVRLDITGDPYGGPGGRYLNPAAFSEVPSPGGVPQRQGNQERNGLRGEPFRSINLGLAKNFNFTEDTRLQFRTEFFNLTNTPQFGLPERDFSNANDFGRIRTTQLFTNRQIQFGLRLEF
ncbi:MAG: TonB-dependent receptor [Acidobacteriota bacterium]|nr:TonB-dependent receptor [Acidobacteriota bacterium]